MEVNELKEKLENQYKPEAFGEKFDEHKKEVESIIKETIPKVSM